MGHTGEEVLTNLDFKAGLIALGITKLCLPTTTMFLDVSMTQMESMLIAISSDSTRPSSVRIHIHQALRLIIVYQKRNKIGINKVCSFSLEQTYTGTQHVLYNSK